MTTDERCHRLFVLYIKQKAYLIEKKPSSITAFGGTSVVPDGHIEDIAKNSI
ncbi:MAG: hypothetical protein ILA17_08030 [Ruminococcus sp.]|nr:hypothetical protein [Ruminococcus sp.]